MAKSASLGILNAPLNIVDGFNRLTVCSAEPTSIANIAAVALADVTLAAGDTTIAADGTGRKVTVSAKAGVPVDATGAPTHLVIDDGTDYVVTTCSGPGLTQGSTVNVPSFAVRMPQPA